MVPDHTTTFNDKYLHYKTIYLLYCPSFQLQRYGIKINTTPATKAILDQADALFHDLDDIHSEESLRVIVKHYANLKDQQQLIGPKVVHL